MIGSFIMAKITFMQTGESIEIANSASLLELEEHKNNILPFGCRSGVCGACAMEVVSGLENLNEKNEIETELLNDLDLDALNHRLGCQCVAYGDVTIEPIN